MRRCGACKLRKPHTEFYKNVSTPDGYSWLCKHCSAYYAKTSRIGHYGITRAQFSELLDKQDGRCDICQIVFDDTTIPVIDHDHQCCPTRVTNDRLITRCGKCIRGLLCRSCNAGLGMFSDDIERMISAIKYLQKRIEGTRFLEEISLEEIDVIYNM